MQKLRHNKLPKSITILFNVCYNAKQWRSNRGGLGGVVGSNAFHSHNKFEFIIQ